jgi:4-hydroxybenzoyl-CoA thioesterase
MSDLANGLRFTRDWNVTWGDCDAAGIVFYPRYYAAFDANTHAMLASADLGHRTLRERYGVLGLTLVETKATFHGPATYDETLSVESQITRLGRSSLTVGHRVTRDGTLLVEGYEIRVWATEVDGALRAAPLPDEVRAVLSGR